MIEEIKILLCMPFLIYACYSDIKSRRVINQVWIVMLAVFSPFILYEIITNGLSHLLMIGISFTIIFVFVYILFYLGAFGGADAKALMTLAIIFPIYPEIMFAGYVFPLEGIPVVSLFTMTLFGNSVLLTVIVPLGLFLHNLTRPNLSETLKKPYFMFIGYRCDVDKLEELKHVRLLEVMEEKDGEVKTKYSRGGGTIDEETIHTIQSYADSGKIGKKVWVTPGLPFIIPITAGFLTAIFYGDLIFKIAFLFMS
ncbi:preflagellin peptidase FlaK [Methanohalophilus levihalophilus]|uniref:A24 family peptidase C-terminal domain-containing protein n=1 Tax=Methanohalophilus levihalophilus TaxID=1431282 RepID=UPI001AE77D91|nr:A24 family peptidase C-terminal domain-containing protein [Methanohalophilus levihalophilus]MBP2029282.1 preflagellin peptidase FlaK [Methanohalophilus levihalophilus]